MIRNILFGIGGVLVLLIAIILVRTFNYGGVPSDVRNIVLPEGPEFDANVAAEHLGEAIRFQTVTVAPGDPRVGQEGPWLALRTRGGWLE